MYVLLHRSARKLPARARLLASLTVSTVALMCCTAGLAAGAAGGEPSEDPSTAHIFAYFFPDISPAPTGPDADALASRIYDQAVSSSRALDYVPRPLAGPRRSWSPITKTFRGIGARVAKADENEIYFIIVRAIQVVYRSRVYIMANVDREPIVDVGDPIQVPFPVTVTVAPAPIGSDGGGSIGMGGRSYAFPASSLGAGGIVTVGGITTIGGGGGGGGCARCIVTVGVVTQTE